MSTLRQNFDFYLAHQEDMVAAHNGKFVVIKDCKVIGEYRDRVAAIEETQKSHELGTFLVQFVAPGDASHTQTFHSRVAFA